MLAAAASGELTEEQIATFKDAAAKEDVCIVNETNEVVGSAPRAQMRAEKMIHRATYAFIRNSQNLFYVQRRSKIKDYCPHYFDPTPGGVVAAGESYANTNRREVEEEMGIVVQSENEHKHLFTFYYEDERIRCWGDAWELVYDGELKIQPEEVESVSMMSMEEIVRRDEDKGFTPDSLFACREYVRLFGAPEPK
jgi:isopentenyldiphosphate isomerase